jgi:hypothetical protein
LQVSLDWTFLIAVRLLLTFIHTIYIYLWECNIKKEFEDTKGVIRIRKWRRTDNTIAKRKRTKEQTTIYKTQYRKLKFEQHEPN